MNKSILFNMYNLGYRADASALVDTFCIHLLFKVEWRLKNRSTKGLKELTLKPSYLIYSALKCLSSKQIWPLWLIISELQLDVGEPDLSKDKCISLLKRKMQLERVNGGEVHVGMNAIQTWHVPCFPSLYKHLFYSFISTDILISCFHSDQCSSHDKQKQIIMKQLFSIMFD